MSTIPLDLVRDIIPLPPIDADGKPPLQQLLRARRSTREFLSEPLTLQQLAELLWSACGVSSGETQRRTAPSAHGWQEISVYALLPEAAYRYDAIHHRLILVRAEDLRAASGLQEFAATAPLNLVYVVDFELMHEAPPEERRFLSAIDTGCIAQNVYLYCTEEGLGTVVRALIDRRELAGALGLSSTERVVLAQSVGHPRLPLTLLRSM